MSRDMAKRRLWLAERAAPVGLTHTFHERRDSQGRVVERGVVVEVKGPGDRCAKRIYLTREQALQLADALVARWRAR